MGSEELKRKIISIIEENKDPIVKAAFYSDEKVSEIMRRLLSEWEKSGYKGSPIDYATIDELRVLADKAEFYRDAPRELYLRKLLRESIEG